MNVTNLQNRIVIFYNKKNLNLKIIYILRFTSFSPTSVEDRFITIVDTDMLIKYYIIDIEYN